MNRDRGKWTKSIHRVFVCLLAAAVLGGTVPAFAGFASTESFLPAVGRLPGKFGAQFYTTVWATNLTGATVSFTFDFLKQGQANPAPASFSDTLSPGETKVYENVVESKLGLTDALGAARVTSSGEVLVAERIYNQEPGDDLGKTEGLFFAGVPRGFSISLGQSATIQGIDQGGAENFRYNFALVETSGGSATVHVALYDGSGAPLGSNDYVLQPYEQLQPNVDDLASNLATTTARITATVTAGTGSVLLAGAQLANESQDSSGFEMSFRDDLLGGGGGGGGLSAVAHDGTLVGNGTSGTPLGVNPAAVVTSLNNLHGAVTLSAGSNVTITPSGQTLTIAASGGGGGGLTLPFTGQATVAGNSVFTIVNEDSSSSSSEGIYAASKGGPGLAANTGAGPAILGTTSGGGGTIGVEGLVGGNATAAVYGQNNGGGGGDGVYGIANTGSGVKGHGNGHGAGVYGENSGDGSGVYAYASNGPGVVGQSAMNYGVEGDAGQANKAGVYGTNSSTGTGVTGYSHNGYGVYGFSDTSYAGYFGGDVHIAGTLSKGGGSFQIDHPLDPANKYLYHSFVESPDMKNIYDGVVTLDESGSAVISLPDWFEALNRDFRYQLTSIGTPQPDLYVAREVENNGFAISGGAPGARVSWQVTGIRHDAYADAHRIPIEEDKKPGDRGRYLHPELFGHAGDPPIGMPTRLPVAGKE